MDAGAAFVLLQLAAIDEGLATGVYGVLAEQVPAVKEARRPGRRPEAARRTVDQLDAPSDALEIVEP